MQKIKLLILGLALTCFSLNSMDFENLALGLSLGIYSTKPIIAEQKIEQEPKHMQIADEIKEKQIEAQEMPNFISAFLKKPDLFRDPDSRFYLPMEIQKIIALKNIKNNPVITWLLNELKTTILNSLKSPIYEKVNQPENKLLVAENGFGGRSIKIYNLTDCQVLLDDVSNSPFRDIKLNSSGDKFLWIEDFAPHFNLNSVYLMSLKKSRLFYGFDIIHTLTGHQDLVSSAQFNHKEDKIITTSNDTIAKVWDTNSGQLLFTLRDHFRALTSATFNQQDDKIATTSNDHTAKLWDAHTGMLLHTLTEHKSPVKSAKVNKQGNRVLTAGFVTVMIWDTNNGQNLLNLQHAAEINTAIFNEQDDKVLTASQDKTIKIWDASTGELLKTLVGHTDCVKTAMFNTQENKIISASDDGTVIIWDTNSGEILYTLTGHKDGADSAMFTKSGNKILTQCKDGTINVWDTSIFNFLEKELNLSQLLLLYYIYEIELVNRKNKLRKTSANLYFELYKYPALKEIFNSLPEQIKVALDKFVLVEQPSSCNVM